MTTGTVIAKGKSIFCKSYYKKFIAKANLAGLNRVFSDLKYPSILGGNKAKAEADGFSYWAAEPKEIFEFRTRQERPFEKLQQALDKYKMDSRFRGNDKGSALPEGIFPGGWIGYFSYELGRYIERIPETAIDDIQMPLIRLCFYDRVIAYDHKEQIFWLLALELPDDFERPVDKLAELEELLAKSKQIETAQSESAELDKIDFSQIQCNMEKDYYLSTIEKIRRYIYDGIVYQVNFSQRFECDYAARPVDLFGWQNQHNPSGYSAYIGGDSLTIVSASPEMFITIRNGVISTKPIKGTRRRLKETSNKNIETNKKNFNELVENEKEQAELNMIIDLERNDLGRICEYGTIKVTQPRTIESYPTVFHAVSTVEGKLREGISFCDCLKAMFPGGSITGAPKVSAMKIIDETEPTARGIYTGSIGYIGIDGSVCLNIAIRTVIITNAGAYVQTGGGIVADSNAEAEWEETITKARALLAGINSVNRILPQRNYAEKSFFK